MPCWLWHLINAGLVFALWFIIRCLYAASNHSLLPAWDRGTVEARPNLARYAGEQLAMATILHPQWLVLVRVAAFPSLFASLLYWGFRSTSHSTEEEFAEESFDSCIDVFPQIVFSTITFGHVLLFFWSDRTVGNIQRSKIVDCLGLSGSESVVSVMCGRGYWTNEIAMRLGSGRVWGVDQWGSSLTPYDQQWILYNSVCEGTSRRISAGGSWDLYHLPFKDNEHDVIFTSWLPWYDEVGAERVMHEMIRCIKPGGQIMVVLPMRFTNMVLHSLLELGALDVRRERVHTGWYMSHEVFTGRKGSSEQPQRMSYGIARLRQASKDRPWQWGFAVGGVALWAAHLSLVRLFWPHLQDVFPGVPPTLQPGVSLCAMNTIWFCLVIIEIHMELSMRPPYVLQHYGWLRAWALIARHHLLTAVLWNVGCWLPGLLIQEAFHWQSVQLSFTLGMCCVFMVIVLQEKLLDIRMRDFVAAFTEAEPSMSTEQLNPLLANTQEEGMLSDEDTQSL